MKHGSGHESRTADSGLRLAGIEKDYRRPTKNSANKLSYNREEKALHGNNLQREHDTGGTPVDKVGE